MESQIACHETSDPPENVFIKDVITSETHHVESNQPVKKQTRQWAAWTRQEEESFFNALRQVGKNFEKITCRVQSKNKDQVRHYYYRLVRRMNKLLPPELSLDAKNSKDTNAAMLRWWSLLEKHSCKASKLHLKPRRFKIFLETLEHQLLKDRKKNIKKRPFQGENFPITPSNGISNHGRGCVHDSRMNLVLVDNQNTQNMGSGKGSSSLRRNSNTCLDRNNCKGDLSPVKPARQRRRSGTASTAAYKKWEKAAIAGVSLVADAAAHLEQTDLDKLVDSVQFMQGGDKGVARNIPPVPSFHQTMYSSNNIQPLTKLKLQLFPINESIRRALETDNHNPHLELTLSCRKKISSVLEHMNRKWGSCSVASGELTLLPYYAQSSNLMSCQKWTQDSVLTAADVYAALGSPSVFRLRYGWFANGDCRHDVPLQESRSAHIQNIDLKEKGSQKNAGVSVFDWADSLTNISVGDLLSDVSHNNNTTLPPASQCLQQIPFSCDSFDAAIAAHFSKNVNSNTVEPTTGVSSIWDAEETCDAFTFRKNNNNNSLSSKEILKQDIVPSASATEENVAEAEEAMEDHPLEVHSLDDGNPKEASPKDLQTLTDMYWPDSLGPLEVELPPCRYQSSDLILSESLGGLTRILTSSLDAFQNTSFFGLEQRESGSTPIGDRETSSFPDHN